VKKVAIKYCGGCDPGYDRVEYAGRIRSCAAGSIEWVRLNDDEYQVILLIGGCPRLCPEPDLELGPAKRLVSVNSDDLDPSAVVALLLA